MNYKKIIKDLKEFNSQLKGQYSDEQNRNYCLQCKVDKLEKEKQELIEYLKKEIEQLENIPKDEEMTLEAHGRLIAYRIILLKIEKR